MNSFELNDILAIRNQPDFDNILDILQKKIPKRPTLFEFLLNEQLCKKLAGDSVPVDETNVLFNILVNIYAFRNAGYDFCTILLPDFSFSPGTFELKYSKSLNDGAVILDRQSFEAYPWPDVEKVDFSLLDKLIPYMPDGMKLIVFSPDGVLENTIKLVGYDNLCIMLYEQPDLVQDIVHEIGSRLLVYYETCIQFESIGAVFGNDDWGYKNQTMVSPEHLKNYVFPWYRRITSLAHDAGKPVILHSCGQLAAVMDDVIDDMQFDGKHSFEDGIQPVEEAYGQYGGRIAILGGIDVDFICRSSPDQIYQRSKRMAERSMQSGGYALGTGNSVPDYLPDSHYFAMIKAALDMR